MSAAQYRRADSPNRVEYLAAWLLDRSRDRPVVVVTVPFDAGEPWIDIERLHDEVGDLVDVWLLPDKHASWQLADLVPQQTQVYAGAGRVYPVSPDWQTNPYESPLRLVMSPNDGERATDLLISDALSMAVAAGLLKPAVTTPGHRRQQSGTVMGVVGSRAWVRLDNGQHAVIVRELTMPGVSYESLVSEGQAVSGWFDSATRRLDVRSGLIEAETALAQYGLGDVILARVETVGADWVVVEPYPQTLLRLTTAEVTDDAAEDLTDLFSPGEVVRARITGLAPLAVRLDDVGPDDDARPAPALLPFGPPWLLAPKRRRRPGVWRAEPPEAVELPRGGPTPLYLAVRAGGGVKHPGTPKQPPRPSPPPQTGQPTPVDSKPALIVAKPALVQTQPVEPAEPEQAETPTPAKPLIPPALVAGLFAKPRPKPSPPPGRRPATAAPAGQTTAETAAASHEAGPATPPPITATKREPNYRELQNLLNNAEHRLRNTQSQVDDSRKEIELYRRELADLRDQLKTLADERNNLQHKVGELKTRLRTTQEDYRALTRRPIEPAAAVSNRDNLVMDRFADPEEQLRWEIYVAWTLRFDQAAKGHHPLPDDYEIGPIFIDSLEALQVVERTKVVDVIVEVLTDLAKDIEARRLHQLRSSSGGGSKTRQREDGALGWRVSISAGAPAAPALHYWKKGNLIELWRVGVHDDDLL